MDNKRLLAAGLFAGIGGIELGLKRAGFSTSLLCEIEESATEVLKAHFPEVPLEPDIRKLDPALLNNVQLLTAGFPCQDLSQAGATNGITGKNSGLVHYVFRLLTEVRVPWVLLENVPFMLRLNKGNAMRYLVKNLEDLGYTWAYRVIDTRSFGLPQRRERVFLLASLTDDPAGRLLTPDHGESPSKVSDGQPCGFYWTEGNRGLGWAVNSIPTLKGGSGLGIPSPPAVWLPNGDFITPSIEAGEALQGFPPGWTKPAERRAKASYRWKLVGNAVTVDVAAWIGERLLSSAATPPLDAESLDPKSSWPKAAFGSSKGRFAVKASPWPIREEITQLDAFMKLGSFPLSKRAASGFTSRLKRSGLRYPPQFLKDLELYIERN
jgi:DNA (cytosine-5)-methyltransferase 1